ncbi:hypothetical protein FA13DRAFT_1814484 [Coprinellus micaceus]|uniref:Nephrocystin 3-like N-terminal domain-containing protein n=1 Tax=Coprinellus micaceus TaxID=71717 RepID=A0A4Y7TAT3_COPMI|nr:hypothetical protein FA13DRAFT_1814484 [Coprinellus micaceus]
MSSPSYFTNARDFHIQTFSVTNVGSTSGGNAFEYLHNNIAIDAVHNSEERYDAPKCHAKTRKAVQEEILGWIMHSGEGDPKPMKILWLTGPAGAGKTAIAGSIADTCHELGILAGSFFFASFTGSERRRSKRYLMATLVYHLILPLDGQHPLRRAILSAIQQDPSIFRRQLREQVKVLLVKPFSDSRHQFNATSLPSAFKDSHEARLENKKDQEEILSALLYATCDRNFPFRFVIASRPEQIRSRYRLPLSWPPAGDIERIVDAASGQLIYAATILRFLQKTRHNQGPQALLRTILDWQSQDGISAFDWSTPSAPASFVNQVLQEFEGQGVFLLESLSSLVKIPLPEDESSPYKIYHKLLFDFLIRRARSAALLYSEINLLKFGFRIRTGMASYAISYELAKCDVAWWVHRVVQVMDEDLAHEPIYAWFETIHKPASTIPGNCLPSCNHWRSNIIRTCKALGWQTPNEIALLREAMCYACGHGRPPESYFDFHPYFKPISQETGSIPPLPAVTTWLPRRWRSQYDAEVQGYGAQNALLTHSALSSVIKGIRTEMGIEVEDLVLTLNEATKRLEVRDALERVFAKVLSLVQAAQ